MNLRMLALVACVAGSASAMAEVEKVAFSCGQEICFRWWPKVSPVAGWQHDRDHSLHYNFNALSPSGTTFATAETVMYANAIYKPRVPEDKTLANFINGDIEQFKRENPGLVVKPAAALVTADGKSVSVYWLQPKGAGQWERVAYFEEGEYYMLFVVSSRSESGLIAASRAYESLLAAYREKP
jgi:hypothetical protein